MKDEPNPAIENVCAWLLILTFVLIFFLILSYGIPWFFNDGLKR